MIEKLPSFLDWNGNYPVSPSFVNQLTESKELIF